MSILQFFDIITQLRIKNIKTKKDSHQMLNKLLKYSTSVYQGISPSLLATLSLSACLKSNHKTNEQLINNLSENKIITDSLLISVMKEIDRKNFIVFPQNTQNSSQNSQSINYYENKPYKISAGQTMTDIFTHSVILNRTVHHLRSLVHSQKAQLLKVIDIGTGHGYLAYVIAAFLEKLLNESNHNKCIFQITGVDANIKSIQYCKSLKNILIPKQIKYGVLRFQESMIEEYLNKKQSCYDVIIGGFYIPPKLNEQLLQYLNKKKSLGIWAKDAKQGQSLFAFQRQQKDGSNKSNIKSEEIMSTMFSQPIIKTSVQRYFIDPNQTSEDSDIQNQSQKQQSYSRENQQKKIQMKKIQKQKRQEQLKQILKAQILKHQKQLGRKLSLKDMRDIPQIQKILEALGKYK